MKKAKPVTPVQIIAPVNFDLVRINKAKQQVDLVPNTVRAYFDQGLRRYKSGKMLFFSKSELESFIRSRAQS